MYPWYFQCHSVTAQKVLRWFRDSLGIICPWLIWWVWCWCGNAVERLQRPEGVNISKGRVRVECMEQSHVAVENTGEHQRMLRMKFYVTMLWNALQKGEDLNDFFARIYKQSQSQRMWSTVKDITDPHDCIQALPGADEFPLWCIRCRVCLSL